MPIEPYVGPRPFEASDRPVFFGRSREINEIVSLIYANRVLLIYSPSGAGKTSLLKAGVLPTLKEDGFEILFGRVKGSLPESVNLEKIRNIFIFHYLLSRLEEKAGLIAVTRSWLAEKEELTALTQATLQEYLKELKPCQDEVGQPLPRLVVFDQFESLFATHADRWENRQDCFEQISKALDSDHLLRVVFILREEFIGEIERFAHFLPDRHLARYRVEPLRIANALRAVWAPIETTGRRFAPGVAEKIITNLTEIRVQTSKGETTAAQGEFIDPVQLQVVMQNLWSALPHDVALITENYAAELGDLDAVLSRFYDQVIAAAISRTTEVSEETLRKWFENSLLTPMGTRTQVIRGQEETNGIPNSVIHDLENQHLVRGFDMRGARLYELTHDRLIRPIQKSNKLFSRAVGIR